MRRAQVSRARAPGRRSRQSAEDAGALRGPACRVIADVLSIAVGMPQGLIYLRGRTPMTLPRFRCRFFAQQPFRAAGLAQPVCLARLYQRAALPKN